MSVIVSSTRVERKDDNKPVQKAETPKKPVKSRKKAV